MPKKIQDLFNREEWLELTLHNCDYQLTIYRRALKKFTTRQASSRDCERYNAIFEYYQNVLVPALIEVISLGEKHIHALTVKNPKKLVFHPAVNDMPVNQDILNRFYQRFENLDEMFCAFIKQQKMEDIKNEKNYN